MNRRIELMGAPINVPDVISGIQTFIENYFAQIIKTMAAKGGIVRPMSDYKVHTPPCEVYVSGGALHIRAGQILFPIDPFPLVYLEGEQIYTPVSNLISSPSNTFHVYATYKRVESGIFKKRASGFVYNDGLPGGYYDRLLDDMEFQVVPAGPEGEYDPQRILVATLYNNLTQEQARALGYKYYGGLSVNQINGAQFTEHGIMAKFADRYLTLNTVIADLMNNDLSAGIKILADQNTTVDWLVVPDSTSYRWETGVPISAADPTQDDEVVTMGWLKDYLIETFYEMPNTFNFRVVDISAISSYGFELGQAVKFAAGGIKSIPRILRVYFKWGYDNILGIGGIGTGVFTISNAELSFSNGELEDYFLWIPELQKSLLIYDNVGNTLYLKNIDGTPFTFPSTITINTPNDQVTNAWIHMNAREYQLSAAPQAIGRTQVPITSNFTASGNTPVYMRGYLDLPALVVYHIQLRGARVGEPSDWEVLGTGTFDKFFPASNTTIEDIEYTNPYLVKHPNIHKGGSQFPSVIPNMTLTSVSSGFKIQLNGDLWLDAEEFEIIYSLNSSINFSTQDISRHIFTGRTANVTVSEGGTYYVKLRPLIARMQVCDNSEIESGSVSAGVSGSQTGEVIAEFDVNFNSYAGTFQFNEGEYTWDLVSITTPGVVSGIIGIHGREVGPRIISNQFPNLDGTVATVEGVDYVVEQIDGNSLMLTHATTGALLLSTHGTVKTFHIGISKRARRIHRSNQFIKDYRITRVSITVDLVRYYPVNMRVYQEGFEQNGYDNITISTGSSQFVVDMDVLITGTQGSRNLIVDLFDPSTGANWTYKNAGGMVGHVKVYAIPVRTIYTIDPVSQE